MAAQRAGVHRPGPLRWLYYAYGGGLGPKYAQWVLHDLTCRTWFIRHLSRTLAQSAPAFLALLLPGDMSWLIFIPLLVVF
ncbi:MAG: DUF5313 family protein, partial [Sciscionella sp.]|nr:DUF5313 family protein [Sciscionella sp.]